MADGEQSNAADWAAGAEQQENTQDREARIERLKPYRWKPGQSGNPKGRPRRKTMEQVALDILHQEVGDLEDPTETGLEKLARVVIEGAIEAGNETMIRLLVERIWPAPKYVEFAARQEPPEEDSEAFPTPDLEALPEHQVADLRRLARSAIMGGTPPDITEAEWRPIDEGVGDGGPDVDE